ncbi:sulfatase-like hydrolase/transferase [Telluribacter sp.]|jgi:arylsulfatase A-like enzyme|uniref:sulfatase-like hydrolase/transferase n=1 Tax=Telluribacter sp. TaxID=1978767 RepID=UPI002E0EC7CD|nr:sulfatase-like hydrolase/transferase [Telluribacter sp.]
MKKYVQFLSRPVCKGIATLRALRLQRPLSPFCLIFYGLLHLLPGVSSLTFAQSTRPNILFIFADDLRADALGCYGNGYVKTPVLDSLARAGTLFTNAYILGGHHGAVCAPSRAMLMSGQSYFRVKDKLKGVHTLPIHLRQNGYTTFLTGKWHNEPEVIGRSFDQARNLLLGGMANHFEVTLRDLKPDGAFTEPVKKGFSTDIFTDTALEFLDQHDGRKPFFAYVPYSVPHDPRSPLPADLALYNEQEVPLPPNFMSLHPFSFGNSMSIRDELLAPFPRTPEVIRAQTAEYYALITHLDRSVGRLIRKLREKGLDKNTLIVFTSDNGLALGSHGLLGKQSVYEHSMHVPLILAGKGIPKNKKTEAFAYLFDLFPTLCQYAGVSQPTGIDGKTLLPIIQGKAQSVRPYILNAYMDFQRSVRDERYKLIRYPAVDHTLLFDLQNDPYELVNLARKPEHARRVQKMLEVMQTQQQLYGDHLPLTAAAVLPLSWDYRTIERKPDQWQPKEVVEKYFNER